MKGSPVTDTPRPTPSLTPDRWYLAARAGTVAALTMLLAQLAWRVFVAGSVQSFPEFIVAAVARLTPLSLFGYLTETFGSWAQNTLFAVVLLGIVAVGYEAGVAAERLVASRRLGAGLGGRLIAGLLVAVALLLVTLLVILPVANLGLLGRASRNSSEIVIQLTLTFAIFGIVWAALATWLTSSPAGTVADGPAPTASVPRRSLLGLGAIGLVGGVGALAWRVMQPQGTPEQIASQETARQIAARAQTRAAATPEATTPATTVTPAAAATPAPDPGQLFAELEAAGSLTPRVTSVADFYHVSKNLLDPTVDGESWTLTIDGLVDNPLTLTYDDLVARATTANITTLCCISNELNGDLVGTAEWTGVPLAELLAEAGVQPEAVDLKFTCADDYEDSIPAALGQNPEVLVVVGMNGEPLTPDHGYPARLIVPPIYGMKNVKWVQRIEAVAEDFLGYWQTRGWDDTATYQIWGRIDAPQRAETLVPGPNVAAGVASAGDRGIAKVEISLDEGQTWAPATLEPSINPPFTWVRWVFPFEAIGPTVKLTMRATDGTGAVMTDQRRPPLPAGATGWPERSVKVGG